MTTTINNTEVTLSFSHKLKSYGHYSIMITAEIEGHKEAFRVTTTDAQFIDEINEMKADDLATIVIEARYWKHIQSKSNIEDLLSEWIDKCDMWDIKEEANKILEESVFDFDADWLNIFNTINRYEGNDLDLNKRYGNYELTITGSKEIFGNKNDAIKGLVNAYSHD